jgi:hypothetical protein
MKTMLAPGALALFAAAAITGCADQARQSWGYHGESRVGFSQDCDGSGARRCEALRSDEIKREAPGTASAFDH